MTDSDRDLPKFLEIAYEVRDRILWGELKSGDEVPSERQLAVHWKVARPTAARAMAELRRLGLVESRVGAGSFVVDPGAARAAGDRMRQSDATGRIYGPNERAVIIAAEICDPPDSVRLALRLGQRERAARRERLTLKDERPTQWSQAWFSETTAHQAPKLLTKERIREGLLYVEAMTGRRIATTEDRFGARQATRREAELLGVPRGSALLCGEHHHLDRSGEPIEFSESVQPGSAWTDTFRRVARP
jgi:DNA-binding GntR family transcriptional regulator